MAPTETDKGTLSSDAVAPTETDKGTLSSDAVAPTETDKGTLSSDAAASGRTHATAATNMGKKAKDGADGGAGGLKRHDTADSSPRQKGGGVAMERHGTGESTGSPRTRSGTGGIREGKSGRETPRPAPIEVKKLESLELHK
eukprot:gene25998-63408_t